MMGLLFITESDTRRARLGLGGGCRRRDNGEDSPNREIPRARSALVMTAAHFTFSPLIVVRSKEMSFTFWTTLPFATFSKRQSITRTFSTGAFGKPRRKTPYGLFLLVTRSISMSRAIV